MDARIIATDQDGGMHVTAGDVGAISLIGAAVVALVVTAAATAVDPEIAQPGHTAYLASGVVMTVVDLFVAIGLLALARTAAVREGRFKTVAFALAVVASIAMVPAEALLRLDFAAGNSMYGVVGPLQAIGLVLVGIGIIRTRRWTGWRRPIALLMGLYIPLLMVPLMVAAGGTSLLALGGYHAWVLALGIATWREEHGRVA